MRKYTLSIVILSIISIFLSGCIDIGNSDIYKISPPREENSAILGTWQIESFVNGENGVLEEPSNYKEEAYFGKNRSSFNNETINIPQYKVKYINLEDYFKEHKIDNSKIDKIELFSNIDRVKLIQISSKDKVFYESIVLKENKIAIFCDNGFYILNRISDKIINDTAIEEADTNEFVMKDVKPNSNSKETGILIGLKHKNEQGINEYRTLWISYNGETLGKIFEIDGILVPRLKGFYKVDIKRVQDESTNKDVIISKQLDQNDKTPMKFSNNNSNIEKEIFFVGNNYISTNVIEYDNSKKITDNYYEVVPLDNTFTSSGISLSYIYGHAKGNQFKDAADSFLKRNMGIDDDKVNIDDTCFAIERRNGNWRLKGGIKTPKGLGTFNINALPPKVIVSYDDLYIPWSYITDKFSNVKDAYTSPNNKVLLLITDKDIEIYEIKNDELKDVPDVKIPIYSDEKSVMAEWASGSYVSRWEEVSKQQGKEIKIN